MMGAAAPSRARQGLKYGILFCLAADIAMFVLVQLVPGLAMRLFTPDAEVIYHGVLYLRTYSIDCILVTFVFTLNGFYSGCGRTGFTLFNSLASTFLVRVPAVFFISLLPGVTLLHIGVAAPAAPPSRCSSSSSTSAPAGGTTRFWGGAGHDRRSAGLPGRRSGPAFPSLRHGRRPSWPAGRAP